MVCLLSSQRQQFYQKLCYCPSWVSISPSCFIYFSSNYFLTKPTASISSVYRNNISVHHTGCCIRYGGLRCHGKRLEGDDGLQQNLQGTWYDRVKFQIKLRGTTDRTGWCLGYRGPRKMGKEPLTFGVCITRGMVVSFAEIETSDIGPEWDMKDKKDPTKQIFMRRISEDRQKEGRREGGKEGQKDGRKGKKE